MSIVDQPWFPKINRPSRYLGNEVNAIQKDPGLTEVSMGLAFPDVYEVGMSHLGLKILYSILNRRPWLSAERIFAPWIDLEKKMRTHGIPLSTLESHRPLHSLDIIGFSLQHELSYTNVLNMLDLAGILQAVGTADSCTSAGRLQQTDQDANGRRLSGSVRTDESKDLALADPHRQ